MNLLQLKQFLLLENTWIHTFSILDIELQLLLQNTHFFQISFPQQGSSSHPIYRRTINPINLLTPIKEAFQTFLNLVKEHNLANETPKFSPNALEELDQHLGNFEVEVIERLVHTHNNPHHWLQADTLR